MTTGEFIRARRKAANMTQNGLADRAEVTRVTVSCWERDVCTPGPEQLINIANVFGCTVDEVLRPGAAE